jgi:hypothetical protein
VALFASFQRSFGISLDGRRAVTHRGRRLSLSS